METTERRIFWGWFLIENDAPFLEQEDASLVPVIFPDSDKEIRFRVLLEHQVSILGRMSEPVLSALGKLPAIVAENIVSHQDVALRAYEIYESGGGGCALDNWLLAERQLLGI